MLPNASQTQCTSRSLTEVFILMRNNVIQSKAIFADVRANRGGTSSSSPDDKLSLVSLNDQGSSHLSRIPPEWVNMVDEVQYEMSRVRTKVKELREIQTKHVLRPSFDDDHSDAEKIIRASSEQILSMLTHCNRLIQHIRKSGYTGTTANGGQSSQPVSTKLLDNVVCALSGALSELTQDFRACQQGYLKRLESREDHMQQYFDAAFSADSPSTAANSSKLAYDDNVALLDSSLGAEPAQTVPPTMAQLQMIDEQSEFVETREREVLQITRSIMELNTLFKDVATLIVDQGTVVDRIDYNIEQSAVRVREGLAQVKKAESYQKKNRKMFAIVVLSGIILFLLVILIISKS